MRRDAPAPMAVGTYVDRVTAEWKLLLDSDPTEPRIQAFLEAHPLMVPGAHLGLGGITPTGHSPFPQALIAQPPLRGLTTRVPDFLWLATDSLVFNPVFIEIEEPGKRWVTGQGRQHHQLTEALDQITDWRDWLAKPANREIFLEGYRVPRPIRERKWQPIFMLIYGRRSENPEAVARIRRSLLESKIITVPYEKLVPDLDSVDYPCIRYGPNGYRAITVPPTIGLGPDSAEAWSLIDGKEQAVEASPWMSAERRAFLIERMPYWDAWGRGERGGVRNLADIE
jgi:hypothetical protein